MSSQKCPNCGAQTAPFRSKCEYCGTILTQPAAAKWIAVKDRLPAPSAADPSRSEYLLTCSCIKSITVSDDPDKEPFNTYDTFVISAYYDFNEQDWFNYNIKDLYRPSIDVRFWMPVPPSDADEWTPLSSLPPAAADNSGLSVAVLLSVEDIAYDSSLFSAQINLKDGSYEQANTLQWDIVLPVNRWHPLPAPPDLPFHSISY